MWVCAYEVPSEARSIRSEVTGGCEPAGANAGVLYKNSSDLTPEPPPHCAVCPPLPPFAAVAADPLSLKQLPLPLPCQWLSLSPLFSLSRPLQNRFKYLIMDSGTTSPGVTSKALPHEACLSVSLAWLTNVLIWGPSVPYPSYARHHSLEPLRVLTRAGPQSGLEKTDFQILETSQGAEEPHLPPQVRLHSVPVPGWCT